MVSDVLGIFTITKLSKVIYYKRFLLPITPLLHLKIPNYSLNSKNKHKQNNY